MEMKIEDTSKQVFPTVTVCNNFYEGDTEEVLLSHGLSVEDYKNGYFSNLVPANMSLLDLHHEVKKF